MSECGHESPIMRRPWPTGGLLPHGKKKINANMAAAVLICKVVKIKESRYRPGVAQS